MEQRDAIVAVVRRAERILVIQRGPLTRDSWERHPTAPLR